MRRREALSMIGGAAVWPLAVRAQKSAHLRRVGVLLTPAQNDPESRSRSEAFERGLAARGWSAHNLQIIYRWGLGEIESSRLAAKELLDFSPEVIVANGSTATVVLKEMTASVPIVFVAVSEPVKQGIVNSLTNPGGNVTGFTNLEPTVGAKWLGLLKELVPELTRVGALFNPKTAPYALLLPNSISVAAPAVGVSWLLSSWATPQKSRWPFRASRAGRARGSSFFPTRLRPFIEER